jgi:hypothetical protein
VHIYHGVVLKISTTLESWIVLLWIKLFSLWAGLIVLFLFCRSEFFITEYAQILADGEGQFQLARHALLCLTSCKVYQSYFFSTFGTISHSIFFSPSRFFWLFRFSQYSLRNYFVRTTDTNLIIRIVFKVAFFAGYHCLWIFFALIFFGIFIALHRKEWL